MLESGVTQKHRLSAKSASLLLSQPHTFHAMQILGFAFCIRFTNLSTVALVTSNRTVQH